MYTMENGVIVMNHPPLLAEFSEFDSPIGIGKYRTVLMVTEFANPNDDAVAQLATEEHKAQYPEAWALFEAGLKPSFDSTALDVLPGCKSDFRIDLKNRGIESVEALARQPEPPAPQFAVLWKQAKLFIELKDVGDAD